MSRQGPPVDRTAMYQFRQVQMMCKMYLVTNLPHRNQHITALQLEELAARIEEPGDWRSLAVGGLMGMSEPALAARITSRLVMFGKTASA